MTDTSARPGHADAGPVAPVARDRLAVRPIPRAGVRLEGRFWGRYQALNRETTIPHGIRMLAESGSLENLRIAAGISVGEYSMPLFRDSDVYKVLEAIAWARRDGADPEQERFFAEAVDLLKQAQRPDGYLNSYVEVVESGNRWANPAMGHELYCAGHLLQAAVADLRTGGDLGGLAAIAGRYAGLLARLLPGKLAGFVPGHPEIETALVEFSRATGRGELAGLAADLAVRRGASTLSWHSFGPSYFQDDVPFELPPGHAYCETCAAVASVMWNWRMLLITGEARFAELIERTLYNGFLAALGQDGRSFYYVNPLHARTAAERGPWHRVACCPPNIMRLLASLDHYIATSTDAGLQLHQFASGRIGADLAAAGRLAVELESGYPQQGTLRVRVLAAPGGAAELAIRVPSWAPEITAALNGRPAGAEPGDDRYLRLRRTWSDGDELTLEFPLRPRTIYPDPRIDAVRSCVAFERGPLVYCFEGIDVPGELGREGVGSTAAVWVPAGSNSAERTGVHVAGSGSPPWWSPGGSTAPRRTAGPTGRPRPAGRPRRRPASS